MAHRRILLVALAVLATAAVAAASSSFADSNPIRPVTERAASTLESTVLAALGRTRHALRFARFAVRYGKSYESAAEVQRRFRIFSESLQEVRSTNRRGLSYKLGINQFSDMTWEEFQASKLGAAQTCSATLAGDHLMRDADALPETKDWRKDGIVSPVKDQSHCGSCWTFRQFSTQGFAAALKPAPFTGTYFKRWQTKTNLWLTAMNVFWVAGVTLTETITPDQEKAFREATVVFVGCVLSVIGDKLVDAYLHIRVAKDLWEALESKFGATDAGSEMYTIEQFHDYRMVENRSVLEQAHEIQSIAKELELLKCDLPGKFVAGCIIAKLPNSWRNFATTLKHQRREFSVEDVIGHLNVEQNSRAKDSHGKGEGSSAANMVQKNYNSHKPKGKTGIQQNTDFKKKGKKTFKKDKKKNGCFTCGSDEHWANKCPNKFKKPGHDSKTVNMIVINNENGASGPQGTDPY